jgi:membrane associated rhomboid family serine protease
MSLLTGRRVRAPETFYGARRDDLTAGFAIGVGILAGLAEGARTWLWIVRGVRRFDPAHGLLNFMMVVVEAAALGAIGGAVIGWAIGFAWERWHRRRRARRSSV